MVQRVHQRHPQVAGKASTLVSSPTLGAVVALSGTKRGLSSVISSASLWEPPRPTWQISVSGDQSHRQGGCAPTGDRDPAADQAADLCAGDSKGPGKHTVCVSRVREERLLWHTPDTTVLQSLHCCGEPDINGLSGPPCLKQYTAKMAAQVSPARSSSGQEQKILPSSVMRDWGGGPVAASQSYQEIHVNSRNVRSGIHDLSTKNIVSLLLGSSCSLLRVLTLYCVYVLEGLFAE
jgi:hypothetical protein